MGWDGMFVNVCHDVFHHDDDDDDDENRVYSQ